MIGIKNLKKSDLFLFITLCIGLIFFFEFNVLPIYGEQQFSYLADSFLHGKLSFFMQPGANWNDTALYKQQHFWPLGPFPALILLPFVFFFGFHFQQGYLQFFLNILNFYLLFRIASQITKKISTSLWLSFGFVFASAYLGLALIPWSWYFAQIVTTTFLLLALLEFLTKKRWFIIGLFLACLITTRITMSIAVVFFILNTYWEKNTGKDKITHLIQLCIPIFFAIILLLLYNFFRFGSFFEQGYNLQLLSSPFLRANRKEGLWSIIHFPANFYYLFLNGPLPVFKSGTKVLEFPFVKIDYWGLSIFFTTPMFLFLKNVQLKERVVRAALITSLFILISLMGYYGIGATQFGYRYAVDFYPFLFLALCFVFKKGISSFFKILVMVSFLANFYLILVS